MFTKVKYLCLVCFLMSLACGHRLDTALQQGQFVDLSHDFSDETIYWPTTPTFKKDNILKGDPGGGFYVYLNRYSGAEHGGTHVDAPSHFSKEGKHVDEIPLKQLIGPAVVMDVKELVKDNRDYQIRIADFLAWEKAHGRIPKDSILLINTGYHNNWPNRELFLGTKLKGKDALGDLHFPGIHPNAATWLVSLRKIAAVGIDTASFDYGQSKSFESHQIILSRGVPAFENVANLDRLPAKGATVFALPMKIKGGSGSPLRIVAWVPN